MLRGCRDEYARAGARIALTVGAVAALLQPTSGDLLAKFVHDTQPAKFAAMEAHFETSAYAPMHVGGVVDNETGEVRHALNVPGLLSFLATHRPSAVVKGLKDIPRDLWPNVELVHLAFDVMVGCGTILMLAGLWFFVRWWRRREGLFDGRRLLWALALAGPLGFVALEAGWVVTEAGRQPWVVNGYLKTADAVTPHPDVKVFLVGFVGIYLLLGVTVVALLRYLARRGHEYV
jgi:cytochrome d ubiquinol oxidase subunit I